jgi:hypothetical protein
LHSPGRSLGAARRPAVNVAALQPGVIPSLSAQADGNAVVTVVLADGEAEAYFAAGQDFTIWADGMAGHTIRAEGLVGCGVIFDPESRLRPSMAVVDATADPPATGLHDV